jgi:hypothetical protein
MTIQFVSSNDFASIVNQLHRSPEDPHLKRQVVKHVAEMKKLAETHPLALYHLAHIYPPKSSQYRQAILQSADLGCTNAMLAACQLLLKTNQPEDLQKAVDYVAGIKESKDSYIIKHCIELLNENPQLAKAVQPPSIKAPVSPQVHRFFTAQAAKKASENEFENQKICKP